jgi:hypothetical protein
VVALKQGNEAEQDLCTVISVKLLQRPSGLYNAAEMKAETKLELHFLVVKVAGSPATANALMKDNESDGLELGTNHHCKLKSDKHI